jgi:hypothetical protein
LYKGHKADESENLLGVKKDSGLAPSKTEPFAADQTTG